jgi:hypothetical protein
MAGRVQKIRQLSLLQKRAEPLFADDREGLYGLYSPLLTPKVKTALCDH